MPKISFSFQHSYEADYCRWQAPELFNSGEKVSPKSDVFAVGVALFELFSYGAVPFEKCSDEEVRQKQIDGQGLELQSVQSCPAEMFEIIQKCIKINADERFSMEQLFSTIKPHVRTNENDLRNDKVVKNESDQYYQSKKLLYNNISTDTSTEKPTNAEYGATYHNVQN